MKYKSKNLKILAVNCGSSSLKYEIISMPEERVLVIGKAERVGVKTQTIGQITHTVLGDKRIIKMDLPDHAFAFAKGLELIKEDSKHNKEISFDIFAHRYVHPGKFFTKTTLIDKSTFGKLKKTLQMAPLHNPISFKLIEFCMKNYRNIQQAAVFDTAFHSSIPKEFYMYALPNRLTKKYSLRKVGFHGISHEYAVQESCRALARDPKTQKIICCHLSPGGSSICAVQYGESINNSMGFTPLEGLIMNTRSGDLDLGAVFYIMFKENMSAEEAETILNKKSGLLGLYHSSSDLKDIMNNMDKDHKAKKSFDMYIRKVKKYVGFYQILLKKADIIVFTDSIGMDEPFIREKVCEGFEFLGVKIDKQKNNAYHKGTVDISDEHSEARIVVVPIQEELMISRAAYEEWIKNDNNSRI